MPKPKIIVHCLIRNEENFIWYSINSILPFVDQIMVWDTGSDDKTIEIVKLIKSSKIDLKECGVVDKDRFTVLRQKMLDETPNKYDWLMILDGDEVWPEEAIKKVIKHLESNPKAQAIFTHTTNAVGDIYHKQPELAGRYKMQGITGNLGLRFISLKNINKLYVNLPYGQEGYFCAPNIPVQELPQVDFVDTSYFHATFLERSSFDRTTLKRNFKRKYELGELVNKTALPEIFFKKHPSSIPDVTKRMDIFTLLKCLVVTLPRRLKRLIISSPKNEGY